MVHEARGVGEDGIVTLPQCMKPVVIAMVGQWPYL